MKIFPISIFIFIFCSCTSPNAKGKTVNSATGIKRIIKNETFLRNESISKMLHTSNYEFTWSYDCDAMRITKQRNKKSDALSPKQLIGIINTSFSDNIHLDFVKISHDTIFVRIKNSTYLTQRMGSCGADEYLTEATFTLTDLSGINFVDFDFEEGDHAVPGTYSKKYFWDWNSSNRKLNNM